MTPLKPFASALAAVACITAAPAWAQAVKLVSAGSEIAFTTRQMGVPVEGKFGKFSANITLDPKKAETGSVSFAIDTGSARFGAAETDAEVVKPVWLSVAAFPQATFQSSAVKPAGPGRFDVSGKLAIKGQVRDIVVPVQVAQQPGGVSTATGSFTIKRLAFKIGDGEWADTSMVADDVLVRFKLVLSGLAPL
jgi:polyisoprenoid-binding protein YceI